MDADAWAAHVSAQQAEIDQITAAIRDSPEIGEKAQAVFDAIWELRLAHAAIGMQKAGTLSQVTFMAAHVCDGIEQGP